MNILHLRPFTRALAVAALITAALSAATPSSAQPNARPAMPQGGMRMGADPLNLTPAQRQKMKPIAQEMMRQFQAISANKALSPEQRQSRMMAIGLKNNARIMAILTPAQRKKAQQMRAQMMASMRGRMGSQGGQRRTR